MKTENVTTKFSLGNATILAAAILAMGLCTNSTLAAGLAGNALLFDGTDDYVHAPYIGQYQLPVFTAEAWVYPMTDTSVSGGPLIGRGEDPVNDHSSTPSLGIRSLSSPWGNGVGVGYEDNSDNDHTFSTDYYPPVDTWTHVAVTRAMDGQLSIYANTALIGQWNSTATPAADCFQELTIGASWNKPNGSMELGGFFHSIIDEVRVWNIARSAAEIADNYNLTVDPASAGLVGYWNFDDGFGTIATDLTSNNNAILGLDGTGTDVPVWINSTAPIIPEPATILLLGLGAVMLRRRR